ncbi:MAG TPA: hypothetical protein VN989_11240 [Casimicrobiaceae bacterium]|nr:hypothetical protein [Casimicrobiaceae bacterium]
MDPAHGRVLALHRRKPANGGDYSRGSDPWVTFAPDGTVYQSSLSFNGDVLAAGSSSAILVSRSTDGGAT